MTKIAVVYHTGLQAEAVALVVTHQPAKAAINLIR